MIKGELSDPGGPSRQRRKEARPAEIVDAARDAFVANGFSATRIDDIARRAGVSKGLVYVYFPSKEALFEAVMRSIVAPVFAHATGLVDAVEDDARGEAPTASDQIRVLVATLYGEMVSTDRRHLLHMIIAEGPRFPAMTRFYHGEVIGKVRDLLRRLIERGVARGEFAPTLLSAFPEILIAPALVAALWKLLFEVEEPLDVPAFMAAHVEVMLRALKA